MKLVLCPACRDVFKLSTKEHRKCECGKAYGWYRKDGINAVIGGGGIPIGFSNTDIARAIRKRPPRGMGMRFEAFVIPHECPTIEEKK